MIRELKLEDKKDIYLGGCEKFHGGCCSSCHEDAEDFYPNYPLSIIETNEGFYEVCCRHSLKDLIKNEEKVG